MSIECLIYTELVSSEVTFLSCLLCVSSHVLLCVCVSRPKFPLFIRTSVSQIRAHPYDPILLFFFFKLYNIVLVLPNIEMNPPQVYLCSPSWTLLPPPSPYLPSGSSQCTSPKHPVSCFKPGLATRFIHDIIHVSMPLNSIPKCSHILSYGG